MIIILSAFTKSGRAEHIQNSSRNAPFFKCKRSTWSITKMVWAFIKIVHAQWSNIVLRENRQWLIRHPKPRNGVRLRYFTSVGVVFCVTGYILQTKHLFQSEHEVLAHFNFQGGICNLAFAWFAWVKTRVGVMEFWKNWLQSRTAYSELFPVWHNICREW